MDGRMENVMCNGRGEICAKNLYVSPFHQLSELL